MIAVCRSAVVSFNSMVITTDPNPVLKQLLTDLEFAGGRDKADFLDICNRNIGFYGAAGSSVRRAYQRARDRLLRKTAVEYRDLVALSGVAPAAATRQTAQMEELRAAMADVNVTGQDSNDRKTQPKRKASCDITPPRPAAPLRSRTPPPLLLRHSTPPASPAVKFKDLNITSPQPSVASVTDYTAFEDLSQAPADQVDPNIGWTEDNPQVIPVMRKNMALPHGFSGMFSDTVTIGSYERDVYFISKTIGGDLDKWKAQEPPAGMFPEYDGRSILVEGPSLDYIHSDRETLDSCLTATLALQKNDIPANIGDGLKRAFAKLSFAFHKQPMSKQKQYYLFVYPPGTVFDNSAISGDGAANQIKAYGIRVNNKFSIFQKQEHTNLICFWAIATQAEEDRRMNEFTAVISKEMYDF